MSDDELFLDARDGIFKLGEIEFYGELILETHGNCDRKRIYKFVDEKEGTWYQCSFLDTKPIICPGCQSETHSHPFGIRVELYDQQHKKGCKFNPNEIHEFYEKENENCDKWVWGMDGEPLFEATLLSLFEFSKYTRGEEYKKFSKLIHRENDRLRTL